MTRNADEDSLMSVDISDALSERERVRFTVHTRTKLPQFTKQNMSVVRQHEEFIWLHDCLEENDNYAGYIIPPAPPRPDFDASREKLQRLGDCEPNMGKDEFAKMKQELEAEYLAIFKKTVAMHEIFLQRLAAHEKFREDNNFKIFLEYDNELQVRCKNTKEKLAGSIQNISKSISDLVISTSQTDEQYFERERLFLGLYYNSIRETASQADKVSSVQKCLADSYLNLAQNLVKLASIETVPITTATNLVSSINDKAKVPMQVPDLAPPSTLPSATLSPLDAEAESTPIATLENNQEIPSTSILPLPLPNTIAESNNDIETTNNDNNNNKGNTNINITHNINGNIMEIPTSSTTSPVPGSTTSLSITNSTNNNSNKNENNNNQSKINSVTSSSFKTCALVKIADYFEQARRIEARIASDEDLKLTDTFLYYKRETLAAQNLLMRRLNYMVEYESALRNLDKARQKGGTQMQYAEVIEKQAKENFVNISKLSKQELAEYKERRVGAFKKAFSDLAELELKHLKNHSQLIQNCLDSVRQLG